MKRKRSDSRLNRISVLTILSVFAWDFLFSQLQVAENSNALQLVSTIIDTNYFKVSNVSINCPALASGTFNQNTSNIGIANGILLTTGKALYAIGPNDSPGKSFNNSGTGNSELDSIINVGTTPLRRTYDACSIEFDFIPYYDTLTLRYVFASEEYLEYVGGTFSDAFAFILSGPGMTKTNLSPIGVKPVILINPSSNPQLFTDNPINAPDIQYDGFTKAMTIKSKVMPAPAVSHLKIVIADVDDALFDSGLFIDGHANNPLQVPIHERNNTILLYQNEPNPFNDRTVIRYFIPESESGNAYFILFDIFGKEIERRMITVKGYGVIDVNTENYAAGIYAYSLLVDGKYRMTKKMICGK